MEFIKVGKNYMIKNGNGRIITEKEKLELENKELIIKDIESNECQGKTTQKLTRNKKRIKKINNEFEESLKKKKIELFNKDLDKITALQKENADDIIKETDKII